MINIKSILTYLHSEISSRSPRVLIIDDEHILDTKTGVEFHMYDDGFKVTHGDELIATDKEFTKEESSTVWTIKQLITDPIKAAKRKAEYPERVVATRVKLADLFENPNPIASDEPEVEDNTVAYTG